MFRLILNKRLNKWIVMVLAVLAMLAANPTPVLANDGCNLLSFIFGGDCVATLDAGMTTRTEIREENATDRTALEEINATARTQLEQSGMTDRTQLEQSGMTERVLVEQMQATQRALIETEAMRDIASQQTTQALANALAAQNSVDRLSTAMENVALYQSNQAVLQKQIEAAARQAWLDKATSLVQMVVMVLLLAGILVFMILRRLKTGAARPQLPMQPLASYNPNQIVRVTKKMEVEQYDEWQL